MVPAEEHPMNESKSDLGRSQARSSCRRRFGEDFKRDAVRLVVEEKYTFAAAAKAVGVSAKSLRDWHAEYAPEPAICGESATLDELREENKRLRKQLKRAELEREILKKATAYFAKESL
jgi:transposase